jgi:hypothetical protein
MRFPLRFTSDFQLGVIARGMQARGLAPLVLKLAPFVAGVGTALPSVESAPRLVWIGGAEPLEYPEIPRFANALAASGREVFLHTNGALLRRRMHEFQPTARFRFALQFDGPSTADNGVALDAIRGAKLSGFLVCGLSVVRDGEAIDALERLHSELHRLDLDGYLVVPPAAETASSSGVLRQARERLLNRRWRRLSEMFDAAVADTGVEVAAASRRRAGRLNAASAISRRNSEHGARDCEEGAQAG